MMISGVSAVNSLLSKEAGSVMGTSPAAAPTGINAGQSFAEMVSDVAERTIGTLQNAEQVSVKAIQGDADMRQVADAVMNAEQSLQAAVAVRDKIVTAYLEISRMAI